VLRELPPRARAYIITVILLGVLTLVIFLPGADLEPLLSLIFFVALSSLTSAFKVQFPIATGSNMSVSYVVDILALILRGPHPTMIVGAVSGWAQTVLGTRDRNPAYRTLFNMSILILTVQAAGQVYQRLGGTPQVTIESTAPLLGMALTYFLVNTVPIAFAIAFTTDQSAWVIWKSEFAPTAPNYLAGAGAAAVVSAVVERSGLGLSAMVGVLPLYLTWRLYRAGVDSEARQGAILEAAKDAIISADQDMKIREFNPAAERMFGWARMSILGKQIDMLMPPAMRDQQVKALRAYLATGGGPLAEGQVETQAVRSDGTQFPIELSLTRVGEGGRGRVTGFVRDITERLALEEQLRQSQKLEAVGRLASGVAHDFNNILMSIVGSADLILMDAPAGHPVSAEASEIKVSVQRGAGLTRQLLAFSRRQATSPRRIALEDIFGGMEVMLRRLIGTEAELEVVRPASPTLVIADPAQIEQVILNLVINARDAMPDGGRLTVRMESVDDSDPSVAAHVEGRHGQFARLSISDTGTGIDESVRARLFEPFFTTKEEGKGSGLGLSIVYGIVKQNGGYVGVISEPRKGATFHVYLPLATAEPPVPA
jgi:PAS domain S-box-containing protein